MAGFIIDEQKFIEDNIFRYEERATSPLSRFLDKAPTFVTYFHINNNESTTDEGFHDIESIVGSNSPVKFQKIDNFPVYGLEAVMLNISDEEQGLDTSYEGELVILPNTIKPLPNDFFIINHLHESFVFRVKEIAYDSIRPDNYYQVSYKFEYLEDDKITQLNEQVHEKYNCVLNNIGTEDKCIIREDYMEQIIQLNKMYEEIVTMYKALFYSDRHNCFLVEHSNGNRLFDTLQSEFCNKHGLFNRKDNYSTLLLSNQFNDPKRALKYQKSMYRFIEKPSIKNLKNFPYSFLAGGSNMITTFYRWYEENILMIDIALPECKNTGYEMFTSDFINYVIEQDNDTDMSLYAQLLRKYIRSEVKSIFDIDLLLYEDIINSDSFEELFFYTPIILYIIKTTCEDYLKN